MLKKVLLFLALGVFLTSPVSFAANANKKTSAKEEYKNILSRLIPPYINYDVKKLNKSVIKGFTQLDVVIKNKKSGTYMHRYLWISKDKKMVIPDLIVMKNGRLERYLPKNAIQHVPVDISWFYNMWKKLPPEMKKSFGKGKTVYMFSDPYCPFCKREIQTLYKMAEEGKIKLYIVPFDVHGKKAEDASAVFLKIEKEKGLKEAIESVEKADFAAVDKIVKKHEKELKDLKKKYSKYLKEIVQTATAAGIRGTPAVIIPTKDNKGYLIVGLSDITPYLK